MQLLGNKYVNVIEQM